MQSLPVDVILLIAIRLRPYDIFRLTEVCKYFYYCIHTKNPETLFFDKVLVNCYKRLGNEEPYENRYENSLEDIKDLYEAYGVEFILEPQPVNSRILHNGKKTDVIVLFEDYMIRKDICDLDKIHPCSLEVKIRNYNYCLPNKKVWILFRLRNIHKRHNIDKKNRDKILKNVPIEYDVSYKQYKHEAIYDFLKVKRIQSLPQICDNTNSLTEEDKFWYNMLNHNFTKYSGYIYQLIQVEIA